MLSINPVMSAIWRDDAVISPIGRHDLGDQLAATQSHFARGCRQSIAFLWPASFFILRTPVEAGRVVPRGKDSDHLDRAWIAPWREADQQKAFRPIEPGHRARFAVSVPTG